MISGHVLRQPKRPTSAPASAAARGAARHDRAAMQIACVLLSVAFAASFEWEHYFSELGLAQQGFATRAAVAWLLIAKTMFCMLPALLLGFAAAALGWRRASTAVFMAGAAAVCFWFLVDLRVLAYTGNHISHYLRFAGWSNFSEWGGGLGPSFRDGGMLLGAMMLASSASLFVSRRFVAFAAPTRSRVIKRFSLFAYALVLAAAVALHRSALTPLEAAALDVSMPIALAPAVGAADQGALAAFSAELNTQLAAPLAAAYPRLWEPVATDRDTLLPAGSHPSVLVLVLESFRSLSFTSELMPRLDALSRRGLRLERHFSASNCSHYGLFSLLYGRVPFAYMQSIREPPQLPATLRASGYRTTYTSSMDHRGWASMDKFINRGTFDAMTLFAGSGAAAEWPDHDRETLAHVHDLLATGPVPPRFIFAFLASTHYPYMYPAQYERHLPVKMLSPEISPVLPLKDRQAAPQMDSIFRVDMASGRTGLLNRYKNAVGFLDDRIADLIESIDLTRTVVIVTGDHGESLWDDGTLAHSSLPSEIETRVPFFMVGAGVPVRSVAVPTSHVDVLPTLLHVLAGSPVPVRGLHGRDLTDAGFTGDHVVLTGFENESEHSRSMVMVGPVGRLSLRLPHDDQIIEVRGSVDARGTLIDAPPPDSQVALWAARIQSSLATFAGNTGG